ncbi:zinc ribbon domain-containing protein [Enterobacter bugandensis]|uniref:zinc ribbon domain-containing protein n=1 Tax=Enterobacter bugandensis TaxID=881260 RepID=UPI001F50AAFD|nr:zinc ribbon domain-containing protein [Enterobacter bugandensis]
MAMKSCRECGQKVSSEAKVCPGCGVKKPYQSPVRGLIFIGIVVIAVFKGCSSEGGSSGNSYHSNDVANSSAPTSQPFVSPDVVSVKKASPVNLSPASTAPFTAAQVCKATIAGMFGRDISSIKTAKTGTTGVYTVSYRRPSDNQRFSYDCKLSDDNVIWRESGQSSERWNGVGNVEFNVVFTVKDRTLAITELHADSDDVTYKFSKKDFR